MKRQLKKIKIQITTIKTQKLISIIYTAKLHQIFDIDIKIGLTMYYKNVTDTLIAV
ncbi:MAG: hypothetical protein IKQ30_02200 [Bacteroidales bacterium]|nr:hypothetical protein [Bacteroidales bacterium]